MYLKLRRRNVKGRCITDPAFEDANSAHERALVFMHKVTNEPPRGKTNNVVSIQVRHKPACTVTEKS